MYFRVSHWSSVAVLSHLGGLTSDVITSSFRGFQRDPGAAEEIAGFYKTRNDRKLKGYLTSWKEHIPIVVPLEHPQFRTNAVSFEQVLLSAESDPQSPLYNETTCAEFHHLLVSALYGYANNLKDLNSETKGCRGQNINKVLSRGKSILFFLRLLWHLTESPAYRLHLHVIGDCLTPIDYSLISHYKELADAAGLDCRNSTGMKGDSKSLESDDDYGDDCDDSDSDETTTPLMMFRKIISNLVAYMNATKMLCLYCGTLRSELQDKGSHFSVTLVSVDYPESTHISWLGVQAVLDDLGLSNNIGNIIRAVADDDKINHRVLLLFRKLISANDHNSSRNRHGNSKASGQVILYPNSPAHCEAVLTSIPHLKIPRNLLVNATLLQLIQVSRRVILLAIRGLMFHRWAKWI